MWQLFLEILKLWNERRKNNDDVIAELPEEEKPQPKPDPKPQPESVITKEVLTWFGRYNGGRGTWYGKKNMNQYPSRFYLTVPGCLPKTLIQNNGSRWAPDGQGGWVLKQSEVPGRGMGVIAPVACRKKKAIIEY